MLSAAFSTYQAVVNHVYKFQQPLFSNTVRLQNFRRPNQYSLFYFQKTEQNTKTKYNITEITLPKKTEPVLRRVED